MSAYKRLLKKEIDSLSETAQNFFHFINAFGKELNLKSFVKFGWQKTGYKTQILLHVEYFNYTFMKTCIIQIKTAEFKMIKNLKKHYRKVIK